MMTSQKYNLRGNASSSSSSSSSLLSRPFRSTSSSSSLFSFECSGQDLILLFLLVVICLWFGGLLFYLTHQPHHINPKPPYVIQFDNNNKDIPSIQPNNEVGDKKQPIPPTPIEVSTTPQASSWSHLPNAALVIITYNRPTYLRQCIDALIHSSGMEHFKLYVSQDGNQPDLNSLTKEYAANNLTLIHHPRDKPVRGPAQSGTSWLAQHYKWAFDELFFHYKHSHVVVVEDDMLVSPDFFILMRDTAYLLNNDPTVWCVSSWHDNGRKGQVYDPYRLFRTDYFPGLGWMLAAPIWQELSPQFPSDAWDHYLRLDSVHKYRSCIVPEISRNKNIGEIGTNMGGSFFARFLEPIQWQQQPVETFNRAGEIDVAHMEHTVYDQTLKQQLENAHILGNIMDPKIQDIIRQIRDNPTDISLTTPAKTGHPRRTVVVYRREDYHHIANTFTFHPVPRSIYKGITIHRLIANEHQTRSVNSSMLTDKTESDDISHWLYFIDIREVNYDLHLPSWLESTSPYHHLIWQPSPLLNIITSNTAESCDQACNRYKNTSISTATSWACSADHLSYINDCSKLQQYFKCERGCAGGVNGPDVPNYVVATEKPDLYQQCLVNEEIPFCQASHWSAQRLCPCVPR